MKRLSLADQVRVRRTCAGCDLCCTAVGVEEINKAPAVRCPHLKGEPGSSCSIYSERPRSCQEFLCLWRGSDILLPVNMFPAYCGFVVALSDVSSFPFILTVHPDPDRPDAWRSMQYRSMLSALAKKFNAIVVVGQAHLACHAFAPSGREFSRADHPEYFKLDGKRVGLPTTEFGPERLTIDDLGKLLWGFA